MSVDSRTTIGSHSRFRRVLATAQGAVAVLLLCGAGLLVRTLLVLTHVDSGAHADNLLTLVVSAGGPGTDATPDRMRRKYEAYEREVARIPGVRAIAGGSGPPLDGRVYGQSFEIEGDTPRAAADRE